MKSYIFCALATIALLSASCEDSLDKFPEDQVTPSTFYKTETDLRLATNYFYLKCVPGASSLYMDDGDIETPHTALNDAIMGMRIVPESGGGWSWGALRDINFYLEHSNQCDDVSARSHYDGVARFFRAWFYFQKVQRFGDVPWYDHALDSGSDELYKPRDSRDTIMSHIIADLDYAIDNLPTEHSLYELTKWTAEALKSRVTLFEGTYRKYHSLGNYEQYLRLCADISKDFISHSGYGISKRSNSPYYQLFVNVTADQTEVVFARHYGKSMSLYHNAQGNCVSGGSASAGLTKRLIDSYLMKDGSRFTDKDGYDTMQLYEESQDRDPRMAQTIRTPGFTRNGNIAAPQMDVANSGYQPIKFDTGNPVYDQHNSSFTDMPIFRSAEVYLNYAEALAELGTITQSDLDISIKPIRDRVGMPNMNLQQANANPDPFLEAPLSGYPNVDQGSNKGVILEIRRERTIELVMEGFRYYDLMRWREGACFEQPMRGIYFPGPGTYDLNQDGTPDVYLYTSGQSSVSNAPLRYEIGKDIILDEGNKGNVIVYNVERHWDENKDYLYPIPIKDRILTNGVLTQNPGWDDGLDF